MLLRKCILTNNNCYKQAKPMTPTGIVVHSTGCNNPKLSRYVAPDDGYLGTPSSNNWNQPRPGNRSVCVHAFIGKLKDGSVATYQTLPFNIKCWGSGSGRKGSYNNSHIQFEICEDALNDKIYFDKVYKEAVEFCAYLCRLYPSISVDNIVCHSEAYKLGYASNHADVMHWFPKFGKSMNSFRSDVKALLNGGSINVEVPMPKPIENEVPFKIKTKCNLNIHKTPIISKTNIIGVANVGVYTITKVQGNCGLLKSGVGWISISDKYVTRL